KWGSKLGALKQVRLLRPGTFAVFCAELTTQSATRSIEIFGAVAGAAEVVLGDSQGRLIRSSRYRALIVAPVAFALQLLAGYFLLAPLAWLFALALETFSPVIKSPGRSGVAVPGTFHELTGDYVSPVGRPRRGLYLSALPARISFEGGMATHVAGFTTGALALGHHLDFI